MSFEIYNPNAIQVTTARPNSMRTITCFHCQKWFMFDSGINYFGQHYDTKITCPFCEGEIGVRE